MNVIEIIREKRETLDLPLRKVAAAADVDTSTWAKIEKGERGLKSKMLAAICELLDLDLKELTIQLWSDKLQKELSEEEFADDILEETNKKLKNQK